MARAKAIGERSCVGCRAKRPKGELWRLVRTAEGSVALDATGRRPGRGAYVCSPECLEAARSRQGLQRALRCRLGEDDYARIAGELRGALERDRARLRSC